MLPIECLPSRRNFLKIGAAIAAGVSGFSFHHSRSSHKITTLG